MRIQYCFPLFIGDLFCLKDKTLVSSHFRRPIDIHLAKELVCHVHPTIAINGYACWQHVFGHAVALGTTSDRQQELAFRVENLEISKGSINDIDVAIGANGHLFRP